MKIEEGQIYLPYSNWTYVEKDAVQKYYHNLISWQDGIQHLYGGSPLTDIIGEIKIQIEDEINRIIKLVLNTKFGRVEITNLSFKQLLVESSYRYGDNHHNDINNWKKDNWAKISAQNRVEICQNELSRWSLILIDKTYKNWQDGKPSEINIKNGDWIDYLEIINNCTTSRGFELKIKVSNIKYHGSLYIPQKQYRKLCRIQAGSWARQGWWKKEYIDNLYSTINNPKDSPKEENPTFGQIYLAPDNSNVNVLISMDRYRTLNILSSKKLDIDLNMDDIIYSRWGKSSEYFTKPIIRKLVVDINQKKHRAAPKTYREILTNSNPKGFFRLPEFGEDGLYNVLKPVIKNKYPLLNKIKEAIITKTIHGLIEIRLLVSNPRNKSELHEIVIGNIKISGKEIENNYLTIDRFCFNPRKTTSYYEHNWLPASEKYGKDKKAIYAFMLGGTINGKQVFIQPENWGIERAILIREQNILTIDLISYERIVPIWQGKINIESVSDSQIG